MDHTISYRYGRNDYIAIGRASRSVGPPGRLGGWGRAVLLGPLEAAPVIMQREGTP
jgi:hypothetical protein